MGDIALVFLLEQIKEVVIGYKDLIAGAKHEFQQLKNELDQLKCSLKDTTRVSNADETSKGLEMRIRELVYDVEDTIDTWLTQEAAAKEKNLLSRCMQPNRINLAQEVKSLRQKVKPLLDEVSKERHDEKAEDGGYGRQEKLQSRVMNKDLSFRRDNVIHLEDQENTLINNLMTPKENLDVISIIGMPGLGKTTLAWRIYQNKKIADEFPIRIWIHVSQRFNQSEVFLSILEQSFSKDIAFGTGLSDLKLAEKICACLEKEKFLLVLDDVWSVEDWQAIKNVLPSKNGMSKVVVTSREKKVGMRASVSRKPHDLRHLYTKESWELLQLEVFEDTGRCTDELERIGRDIVERCDGVPLTIRVVGGILSDLYNKTQSVAVLEKEWINVSQNVNRILERGNNQVKEVVGLSYHRLPDDLKDCFLYLGVFPENYEIPARTLTRLWIAEEFIRPCEEKTLEESAEENLYDLINRNLLMVGDKNLDQVKTCRVHDMIRAFCRSTAMERNLFQVTTNPNADPQIYNEAKNCHRLCLHCSLNEFLSNIPTHVQFIRSFLYFYEGVDLMEENHVNAIPRAFQKLRVLHTKSIKFHEFPGNLNKLTHLRYMVLYINNLKHIPEQISQLWNLQTLMVDTNSSQIEMKANIWKMIRFRHLKTKAAIVLNKNWKGKAGKNLQTLSRVSPESLTATVSKRATSLKTLGIQGKLDPLIRTMSLENFCCLERLRLVRELPYESASENPLPDLPPSFPPYLKRLTLSNTFLDWKNMSRLRNITGLEVIKLKSNAFKGYSWTVDAGAFNDLQLLVIVNSDLVLWKVQENSFSSLRCLVLKHCMNLQQIPLAVAGCLEKLEIDHLRRSAVFSAREIEKNRLEKAQPFKLTLGPGCVEQPIQD